MLCPSRPAAGVAAGAFGPWSATGFPFFVLHRLWLIRLNPTPAGSGVSTLYFIWSIIFGSIQNFLLSRLHSSRLSAVIS